MQIIQKKYQFFTISYLKAAMAINTQVLLEMEIPDNYVESLPKVHYNKCFCSPRFCKLSAKVVSVSCLLQNGRSSLGDTIYKSITDERFDPEKFLSTIDLSLDHKILDLKNRIEASIVIWTRKMMMNKDAKSSWSSIVSLEKRELFEDRAKTLLLILKHRYPGVSQSELDISKIQYNHVRLFFTNEK